jgi:hypothetical protein
MLRKQGFSSVFAAFWGQKTRKLILSNLQGNFLSPSENSGRKPKCKIAVRNPGRMPRLRGTIRVSMVR